MSKTLSKLYKLLAVCLVTVVLLVGVGWGLWSLMLLVPGNTARLWALLSTAGMPVSAWFFWWLGHTEVRGLLSGFDQAVDKMCMAITRSAGLVRDRQPVIMPQMMEQPTIQIIPAQTLPREQLIEM